MLELVEQILAILRGMWQRRWIGLGIAWVSALIGVIVVVKLPDKYEASARVYVDTQSLLAPLMAGMAMAPNASQQVDILSRLLMSRPNLEKIIRKADLDTSSGKEAADLVDSTAGSLTISRAGGDNLYTIAFRWTDGRKARDVVQAALSTFIEQSLGQTRMGTDSARKFVDEQIREYEGRLREAEARVQAFRLKNMALLGASGRDYISQMASLSETIKDAKLELRVAEQTRDGIRKQLEEQTERGITANREHPVVIRIPEFDNRIEGLNRQLDELLRKYTEQHPDVIGIRRLVGQLEEERDREIEVRRKAAEDNPGAIIAGDPVAQQLRVALNEAEANVTGIRARMGEYEARYTRLQAAAETLPKLDTELVQLNRDYGIQKGLYDNLVTRRETATLTGKLEEAGIAEFRIIDPPRVTPNPVAPNRKGLVMGVIAISLLAGLAGSWLVSQVRPTFHDARALRELAQRPLLGIVCMLPNDRLRKMRRRAALLFAGGLGGLFASYAAALALIFLVARGS